jgi:DNA-binding FadR family transcriptional regulator
MGTFHKKFNALASLPVNDLYGYEATAQGRIHGDLARRLGVAILNGGFSEGAHLPMEMEAPAVLHVSRSAYREAIRILAAKGLVDSRPRAGTWVTVRARWNILDPEVLGWMFDTEPTEKFILALFELRLITEPAAAGLAALRRTEVHLKTMSAALQIMADETLATEAGQKADLEFHRALLGATDNEALTAMSHTIGAAVAWSTRFKQRRNPLPRDPIPDHVRVFEAISARDAGAAKFCMETLIRQALDDTRLSMSVS